MGTCRMPIAFIRRRQKYIIILFATFALVIYGVAKSDQFSGRISDTNLPNERSRKSVISDQNTKGDIKKNELLKEGKEDLNNIQKENSNSVCLQTYPPEAVTDFNTYDLYGSVVAQNGVQDTVQTREKRRNQKLTVFVQPMTHVDPGWLRTFDSYSDDTNKILNNMLSFLKDHPKMRFTWCETAFFERWWKQLNQTEKKELKSMVLSGQIEMTSGSWVMSDEANPYFAASIDNIIEGQQFIYNELEVKPKVIWSNDPFGYGPTIPYLFTKTGIKRAVINRVHHTIKNHIQNKHSAPFKWRQHFDAKGLSDVYTHMLPYTHYDVLNSCGPSQSICCEYDFKRITHFTCPGPKPVPITHTNVVKKALELENQLKQMSELYESNVLLAVWGDDFRYDMIEEWHQQYDNLIQLFEQINYLNNTQIRFGTFSDYFDALEKYNEDEKIEAATLSGDLFPYQCALGDLWTGYYVTRPFMKKLGRQLHSYIRAADLATVSASKLMSNEERVQIWNNLTKSRRILALFQHHDAITGTSKKHVMENYGELLFNATLDVAEVLKKAINVITKTNFENDNLPIKYNKICSKTLIDIGPGKTVSVAVFNSQTRVIIETIKLRVTSSEIKVTEGISIIPAQIEPYFDPVEGIISQNEYTLIYHAELQPLSTSLFKITYEESPKSTHISEIIIRSIKGSEKPLEINFPKTFEQKTSESNHLEIRTSRVTIKYENNSFINSVETESSGRTKFEQTIAQYANAGGGAYTMNQMGPAVDFPLGALINFIVIGPLQQTIFSLSENVQQIVYVREVKGHEGELINVEMRLDIRNQPQMELITRFNTDLDSKTMKLFTDSNGLQLIKREYHSTLPIKSNYYPMPTALVLQDSNKRISFLSDVEHAATKFGKTGAEIMIERMIHRDDGKGLGGDRDGIPDDMLPVHFAFTIAIEKMKQNHPNHYAYHSLESHLALQSLLYKPMTFITNEVSEYIPGEGLPSFPCDVQMITAKTLPNSLDDRLFILHRPGIDCSSSTVVNCPLPLLNKSIKEYLKSVGISKIQMTSLNGIEKIGDQINIENLKFDINPMDFISFIAKIS